MYAPDPLLFNNSHHFKLNTFWLFLRLPFIDCVSQAFYKYVDTAIQFRKKSPLATSLSLSLGCKAAKYDTPLTCLGTTFALIDRSY